MLTLWSVVYIGCMITPLQARHSNNYNPFIRAYPILSCIAVMPNWTFQIMYLNLPMMSFVLVWLGHSGIPAANTEVSAGMSVKWNGNQASHMRAREWIWVPLSVRRRLLRPMIELLEGFLEGESVWKSDVWILVDITRVKPVIFQVILDENMFQRRGWLFTTMLLFEAGLVLIGKYNHCLVDIHNQLLLTSSPIL